MNSDLSIGTLDTQALDALPVAVCVSDREDRIVRFNQRAVDMWGRPPASVDIQRGPAAQVIRTGQAVRDVTVVIERHDGSTLTASVTATPLTDTRGLTVAAVSTFVVLPVDADAELHRARLAAIVVSSDDAILSKTLDGAIEFWNIGAERIFGYTAEEAIGRHISLILPPDRLDEESDVLARLRRGDKIDHFETVRRAKDGRLVDVSMTVSPIKGLDGRIVGASNVARDITERRLAHEALTRSRRRYQRIFESAGVSIWDEDFTAVRAALDELRATGVRDFAQYFATHSEEVERYIGLVRVVDVNETTLRMFGATDKRAVLASLDTIFVAETREIFAQELVALAEGHTTFEAESVLRTLHGDRVDVLVSITFPVAGEPADSVLVTLTDITLQKLAEQARRDSEALFHEMADTAPAMLWISDSTGAWTFLSRQWYELTGQEPENALGLGWLKVLHPDDRDSAADAVFEATDQRRPFHFECRLSQPDGDSRWTIIAGQPRLGNDGEFLGFVGSAIDITERRKAEEAVIEEVHTRETLSRVGAALASELDPDRLIQSAIDAATALTSAQWGVFFFSVVDDEGKTHEHHAVSGLPAEAFASPPDVADQRPRGPAIVRIDDLLSGEADDASHIDRRWLPQDLLVRSYLSVPVVSRTGEVRGGVCFGHTRAGVFRPRHEQLASGIAAWAALALDNASLYKEAQEANRAKDEFIATLSHELRTPLNAMLGWAHMLRANVLPPETQRRALETLERNVRTQAQLVDDLLDVSRIVAGKLHIKGDEVDLTTVVTTAADTVRPATVAKGLSFRVIADPDQQVIVIGDADRIRQILWNLLTNAVKFTPKGGRVEIELRTTDTGASVVVTDTGQGIRQDFLRHVFERFRQADSTASRRHGGLGLGLAIVRHLTEAHGGSVSAESPGEGLGATFTLQLPVREVRTRAKTGETPETRGTALSGLRVLLVDDEADTRDVLRVLLEVQGANVTAASSAGEALEILRRHPTDVLLADIGMPEQDGYALIEAVRALTTSEAVVPAVAVTAYVSSRDRTRAFKAGYGWHLAKPVDPDQLIAVVSAAARSHPSASQPS
ncbi:MAG TPA: PAS domain S-box protein [Vicinamibacterales bacterium]|nr:PAS domain S-box protein [Vicinamibacterales bacterium]